MATDLAEFVGAAIGLNLLFGVPMPVAAGITAVEGEFDSGDVVELLNPQGDVVARGVVAYDAGELPELVGRSTYELPPEQRREVVHADDLVPLR